MHITYSHIPFSIIADMAEGRLPLDSSSEAHLAACPACAAKLSWLRRTFSLLRSDTSEEPSARAVADVKALFHTRRRQAPRPSPLAALLRFDSARAMPAFGLRAAAATERQLLFSAGPYDVDLRVAPAGDRWAVTGQLFGNILGDRGYVEILGPADGDRAELSPESEFYLRPVRTGTYSLTINLSSSAIVLSDVELGTR